MPITAIPGDYLSATIATMKKQIEELTRALGRPSNQVRDANDNVIEMVGATGPTIAGRGHDVGLSLVNGAATVTDGQGRDSRPMTAQQFNGPVTGDTTGVHHGDVGTPSEAHNHYGDLHGNGFGFWYGPVGDGTTQNQINCLRVFHTGAYGDIGDPGAFFQLYGTVHAPSERGLKEDVQPLVDAGAIVDKAPSYLWRWDPLVRHCDGELHAGPMVDDIAEAAPWMIRGPYDSEGARLLADRDLIGVLWEALREERKRTAAFEQRLALLESRV